MHESKARVTLGKAYSPRESFPLGGYAAVTFLFNSLLLAALRSSGKQGERAGFDARDVILAGVATHKLSRIITRDAVTSFLRAPFTRFQEPLGYGEVDEKPRRQGSWQVLAELLNCSYCMSAWAGLGLFWGMIRFPRQGRLLASFFSVVAIADFLHVFYEERRTRSNVLTLEEEKLDAEKGRVA